jgi:hypothetical protein
MGRRKQSPEYPRARRALAQHLHRHHGGITGRGMLDKRLDLHEELHLKERAGNCETHSHEPCGDGETDIQIAFRVLREGENGQANVAGDAR